MIFFFSSTLSSPPPQAYSGGRREAGDPQVQHLWLPRGLCDVDEGHAGPGGQFRSREDAHERHHTHQFRGEGGQRGVPVLREECRRFCTGLGRTRSRR